MPVGKFLRIVWETAVICAICFRQAGRRLHKNLDNHDPGQGLLKTTGAGCHQPSSSEPLRRET